MGTANINTAKVAEMRDRLPEVSAMDARWFATHPGRTTYLRHATEPEVYLQHDATGLPIDPGPGAVYFVLVRHVAGPIMLRQCVRNDAKTSLDISDKVASALWWITDLQHGTELCKAEAQIRRELTPNGRTVH